MSYTELERQSIRSATIADVPSAEIAVCNPNVCCEDDCNDRDP